MQYLHCKNKKKSEKILVPGQNFEKNLGCGNPDSQKSSIQVYAIRNCITGIIILVSAYHSTQGTLWMRSGDLIYQHEAGVRSISQPMLLHRCRWISSVSCHVGGPHPRRSMVSYNQLLLRFYAVYSHVHF
jgi:hypothetical protein